MIWKNLGKIQAVVQARSFRTARPARCSQALKRERHIPRAGLSVVVFRSLRAVRIPLIAEAEFVVPRRPQTLSNRLI